MSITSSTEEYIRSHASVSSCLKKGIINYSALARVILHETGMVASEEAVMVASRRLKAKLNRMDQDKAAGLFRSSNIEIKNNIVSYTLDKQALPESLIEIEKEIKKESGLFFAIEGMKTITVILQTHNQRLMRRFSGAEVKEHQVLISITTKGIGVVPGAVAYIAGRFAEARINIEEFMSCHDDTLIVIQNKDLKEAIGLLSF